MSVREAGDGHDEKTKTEQISDSPHNASHPGYSPLVSKQCILSSYMFNCLQISMNYFMKKMHIKRHKRNNFQEGIREKL